MTHLENTNSARRPAGPAPERLLVSVQEARRLLGVGNTKTWSLIGSGDLQTVRVGRRRMVTYASVQRLADPEGGQ